VCTTSEKPRLIIIGTISEFRANYKWFYLSTILDDFSRCMIA